MSAQNLPGEEETVKGADIAPPGEAAIAQASEHDGIPRRYLPHRSFNQEDLRSYLGQLPSIINRWSGEAGDIFKDVETMCQQPCLFSTSSESANDDTYIEIYDVSPQGVVFRAQLANNQMHTPTALEYWQLIKVVLNIFLTAMIFFYVLEADTNQDDTIFNFRTYKDSRKNCVCGTRQIIFQNRTNETSIAHQPSQLLFAALLMTHIPSDISRIIVHSFAMMDTSVLLSTVRSDIY